MTRQFAAGMTPFVRPEIRPGAAVRACWASHTVARLLSMSTSATAQCGPIGMKLLYWYM